MDRPAPPPPPPTPPPPLPPPGPPPRPGPKESGWQRTRKFLQRHALIAALILAAIEATGHPRRAIPGVMIIVGGAFYLLFSNLDRIADGIADMKEKRAARRAQKAQWVQGLTKAEQDARFKENYEAGSFVFGFVLGVVFLILSGSVAAGAIVWFGTWGALTGVRGQI